jgi:hypothetical protein
MAIYQISGTSSVSVSTQARAINALQDDANDLIFWIDLRPTTPKIDIQDTLDYTAMGWDINDVVANVILVGPGGAIYTNEDIGDPEIVPATSRFLNKTITLPLDPTADPKNIIKGNYTLKVVWYNSVLDDYYTYLKTFNYNHDPVTITNTTTSGPYSGILKSIDTTDYGDDAYSVTRTHRVQYPTQLVPAVADVVSGNAEVSITPIYTNQWTIQIGSYVEYRFSDLLRVHWEGSEEFTHCVYGACIGAMADAINNILDTYIDDYPSNIDNQEYYQKRIVILNTAWHLLNIAYQSGDVEEADAQAYIIQEQVAATIGGVCEGDSSDEVTPCPAYDGGGSGGTYTFENGLTLVGGDTVRLGGTLTQSTSINMGAYGVVMNGSSVGNSTVLSAVTASGVVATSNNGSIEGRVLVTPTLVTLERADLVTAANTRGYQITSTGIIEKGDYKVGYVDRQLVAKDYVDAAVAAISLAINTDSSINGDGSVGSPLVVANPFPGFTDLNTDYGYTEPTHAFADLTSTPTTIAGYGITDAVTAFLGLSDTPSAYTGHASKLLAVNATQTAIEFITAGGWVPSTGGTFTGQITIQTSNDYPLVLQQIGAGSTGGVAEAGANYIQFQDNDGDIQGYVGISAGGDMQIATLISGGITYIFNDLDVEGDITLDGTVDGVNIADFYAAYLIHEHSWNDITSDVPDFVRADNDYFSTQFAAKGSAVAADRILIEDSADSLVKKYVTLGNLPVSVSTFIGLSDVPTNYSGAAGYLVRVNATPDGLEFIADDAWIHTANGTLNALSEKVSPSASDVIIIEDAADSFTQKKAYIGNLSIAGANGYNVATQNVTLVANTDYPITTTLQPYMLQFFLDNGTEAKPSMRIVDNLDSTWTITLRSSIALEGQLTYLVSSTGSVNTITTNIVNGLNSINLLTTVEPFFIQIYDSNGVLLTGITPRKTQTINWYVGFYSSNPSTIANAIVTWI